MNKFLAIKQSANLGTPANIGTGATAAVTQLVNLAGADVSAHATVTVLKTNPGLVLLQYEPAIYGDAAGYVTITTGSGASGGLVSGDLTPEVAFASDGTVRTSQLPGIHNDGATDDSSVLNAAMAALAAAGGGKIVWDGKHYCASNPLVYSGVEIEAIDRTPRLILPTDVFLQNAHIAGAYPTQPGFVYQYLETQPTTGGPYSLEGVLFPVSPAIHDGATTLWGTTDYVWSMALAAGVYSITDNTNIAGPTVAFTGSSITGPFTPSDGYTGSPSFTVVPVVQPTIIDQDIVIRKLGISGSGVYGTVPAAVTIIGATHVRLEEVTVSGANQFSYLFGNISDLEVLDCDSFDSYEDALHIWGPIRNAYIRLGNMQTASAQPIALNWGECDWENTYAPATYFSAGDVVNITIDALNAQAADIPVLILSTPNCLGGTIHLKGCKLTGTSGNNIFQDYSFPGGAILQTLILEDCVCTQPGTVAPSLAWKGAITNLIIRGGSYPTGAPLVSNAGTITNFVRDTVIGGASLLPAKDLPRQPTSSAARRTSARRGWPPRPK